MSTSCVVDSRRRQSRGLRIVDSDADLPLTRKVRM